MSQSTSNQTAPTLPKKGSRVSEAQKQAIKTLINDVKSSIDSSPSETSVATLKADLKAAWSDRTITQTEFKRIVSDALDIVDSAGVTPTEARVILYDLQDIAQLSRLPKKNDNLTGTAASDLLWSGLGNDTLTGAVSGDTGINDIDLLCGGGGSDTFVLGNSSQAFYDDGVSSTAGLADYAMILDFNKKYDTIRLQGSASDYSVSALPSSLGIGGTGIYRKTSGSVAVPELVGVVVGVTLTDFSAGFAFVA